MPMTFQSLDELDYVSAKLYPMLDQGMLAKGYLVLFWSDSGWVRFFTKSPILHPDDLKKMKLFSWAGNIKQYDLWKASGFNPVMLDATGIVQGLMNDNINAIPMPPFFALASQLQKQTKYMLELNWAPLVGATVVRKKSWDRIPENLRDQLLKVAADIGKQIKADGRAENENSVKAMAKNGLLVQKVSPEIDAEWLSEVDKVRDKIRGNMVPAETYDEAWRLLKEFREKAGDKAK
jgi:TRAP-type C4-dicarboxylate transport system substrate-binding protein